MMTPELEKLVQRLQTPCNIIEKSVEDEDAMHAAEAIVSLSSQLDSQNRVNMALVKQLQNSMERNARLVIAFKVVEPILKRLALYDDIEAVTALDLIHRVTTDQPLKEEEKMHA